MSPRPELVAEDLLSIRFSSQRAAELAACALREQGVWLEVVSGVDCVFVQFDNLAMGPEAALAACAAADAADKRIEPPAPLEIPVCYDASLGLDIESVCERLAITRDQFITRHTGSSHEVRMLGFMPGFAYVDGLGADLAVDRREQPRQSVAAGSVAIAGRQTGIYALPSPGGWQVVGRTPLVLFDADRDPPALLQAGQAIRFRAISADEFRDLEPA